MNRTHVLRQHPSAILLAGQLAAVLIYPFIGDSTPGRAALGGLGTVLVLAALYAVRRTPALAWVALILGVPALVCNVLEVVWPTSDGVLLASALLHAPFYFYVSYGMIRYLFHDDRVTRDGSTRRRRLHGGRAGLRLGRSWPSSSSRPDRSPEREEAASGRGRCSTCCSPP